MLIMIAILVVVVIVSFIGILSRYRKCKSDEVLVVYGKTSGEKSAKLYHGGAAFVWPIIQGYEFLSMKPLRRPVCAEYPCGRADNYYGCYQYRSRSDAERSRTFAWVAVRRQTKPDYGCRLRADASGDCRYDDRGVELRS